mmetsp:Transcript_19446/g.40865  ORF Transcript_19446/g.40865 Transcript_19446/m.40865 type:complete len:95 (+) Transcript_19446:378-662(+)
MCSDKSELYCGFAMFRPVHQPLLGILVGRGGSVYEHSPRNGKRAIEAIAHTTGKTNRYDIQKNERGTSPKHDRNNHFTHSTWKLVDKKPATIGG